MDLKRFHDLGEFQFKRHGTGTPSKISMEPESHLFEKENHLPNLHYCVPC